MDPLELRSEHAKTYLEPSVKKRITKYQIKLGFPSFSDALRDMAIKQLEAEGL